MRQSLKTFVPLLAVFPLAVAGQEIVFIDSFEPTACNAPTDLNLSIPVMGSTDSGFADFSWTMACSTQNFDLEPVGPETAFRFQLAVTTMLSYRLTPVDTTNFGVYVRGECGRQSSELAGFCALNEVPGNAVQFDRLTPAGEHFILVDDFAAQGSGPGEFDLVVVPIPVPACHGVIPQLLEMSEAPINVAGDTAIGSANTSWLGSQCGGVQDTLGNEQIFGFALAEAATLSIDATPTNPSSSRIGVYLRAVCDDRFSQLACAEGDGAPATLNQTLPPGEYYLVVDDFLSSVDESQEYSLSITVDN